MNKKLKNILIATGIPIASLASGAAIGSGVNKYKFKKNLSEYNREENQMIAQDAYVSGLTDAMSVKTSALSPFMKKVIVGGSGAAALSAGYVAGDKIQSLKNREKAKAFNKYNAEENDFIFQNAYNAGFEDGIKKASLADILHVYEGGIDSALRGLKYKTDEAFLGSFSEHSRMPLTRVISVGMPLTAAGGAYSVYRALGKNMEKQIRNKRIANLILGGTGLTAAGGGAYALSR